MSIPAIDVKVPLYLGATKSNLSKGAGVISGTTAPLGELDSNCVIAAHRSTVLRRIESLVIGDVVAVTTPWETLHYRIVKKKIIKPSDIDSLAIQSGRDLVTLFTCHPYGRSTHRYLVICERDETVQVVEKSIIERIASFFESVIEGTVAVTALEDALKVCVLCVLAAVAVLEGVLFARKRIRKK